MKNKFNKNELLLIAFFILIFIAIRSIHFSEFLNFSFDQAWSSTRIMEIWKSREVTLVGPGSSIVVHGKQILQGSINYYFQMIFLLLGNFDPIISSYIFMLFTGMMIIPLYFGVKYLFNQKIAIFIVIVYALLPLYIDFTRFLFGPNFQFSLLPLIILFMGLYKKTKKLLYFFMIFFLVGVESQFHFAFLLIFVILFIWSFWQSRRMLSASILPIIAFLIGFSPIIIFELKNNFYNISVFIEYLKYKPSILNFQLLPHRYLSISLIILILLVPIYKKYLSKKFFIILTISLLTIDLFLYLPKPKHAFGMNNNWNYLTEKKAYEIVKSENLQNYNVVNLIYDNLSVVIKYHLKKDGVKINYDDYYNNDYLFVINKNENIFNNPAYEVNTFKPNKKIKQWELNNFYNLYLFKRIYPKS